MLYSLHFCAACYIGAPSVIFIITAFQERFNIILCYFENERTKIYMPYKNNVYYNICNGNNLKVSAAILFILDVYEV